MEPPLNSGGDVDCAGRAERERNASMEPPLNSGGDRSITMPLGSLTALLQWSRR